MSFLFNLEDLQAWATTALTENTKVYKVRKALFDTLNELLRRPRQGHSTTLKTNQIQAIKNYLTARNDQLNDPMGLAFDKTVEAILLMENQQPAGLKDGKVENKRANYQAAPSLSSGPLNLIEQRRQSEVPVTKEQEELRNEVQALRGILAEAESQLSKLSLSTSASNPSGEV